MTEEAGDQRSWGPKSRRSETVTIRLEPRLKYLADLAAQKQRRSLSSFIEWAVEDSLSRISLSGDGSITIKNLESDFEKRLWDVDDSERFMRKAIHCPELLDTDDLKLWKMIEDSLLLLPAQDRTDTGARQWNWAALQDEVFPTIRDIWPSLMMAFVGTSEKEPRSSSEERRRWVEHMRNTVAHGRVYPRIKAKKIMPPPDVGTDEIPF